MLLCILEPTIRYAVKHTNNQIIWKMIPENAALLTSKCPYKDTHLACQWQFYENDNNTGSVISTKIYNSGNLIQV